MPGPHVIRPFDKLSDGELQHRRGWEDSRGGGGGGGGGNPSQYLQEPLLLLSLSLLLSLLSLCPSLGLLPLSFFLFLSLFLGPYLIDLGPVLEESFHGVDWHRSRCLRDAPMNSSGFPPTSPLLVLWHEERKSSLKEKNTQNKPQNLLLALLLATEGLFLKAVPRLSPSS